MKNSKGIVAILVSVVIVAGIFVSCTSKDYTEGEKQVTVVVTDESGEAVTDENGAVLTKEVKDEVLTDDKGKAVTEVVTNNKGVAVTYSNGQKVTQVVTKKAGTQAVTDKKGNVVTEAETNEQGVTVTKVVTEKATTSANKKETTTKKGQKPSSTTNKQETETTTTPYPVDKKRKLKFNIAIPYDTTMNDVLEFYVKNSDDEWELVDSFKIKCDGSTIEYETEKEYKGDVRFLLKLKHHAKKYSGLMEAGYAERDIDLSAIGIDIIGEDMD